jgi:chemotaxis protein methyltransferase CheR
MPFDADSLGLQPAAISLLRDLVHERLGIYYEGTRCDSMADRLAALVTERGFPSFLDYFYFLKYDASAAAEWNHVIDALSVPETYFWREIDQIQAVATTVMPELVRRAAGSAIRIWSVPCATGEEPLTIAMVLEEHGWFARAPIEIHAADASPAALARARGGVYRERAFRTLPPLYRERYFTAVNGGWQVLPTLQGRVSSWRQMNLMNDGDVATMASCHIIFCRNVFIYFSPGSVRRVVNTLAELMLRPGFLCVGASESLLRLTDRFELEEIGGAFIYTRR